MAHEYAFITERVERCLPLDEVPDIDPDVVHEVVCWLKATDRQHTATSSQIVAVYDAFRWKKETCLTNRPGMDQKILDEITNVDELVRSTESTLP